MDGVLTNFEKRYDELFGIRPSEQNARTSHFWRHFEQFIVEGNFRTLEKHPDADKLLQFVHEMRVPVEILTSSGGEKHHAQVTKDKITWLCNNGIPYKANVVPGGSKKAMFADPWHILIDDTPHVVEKYRAAGGTAILHYDINVTLKELAQLHLEWQGGE
jgi:5'(3')-deoxyribonucleotidase